MTHMYEDAMTKLVTLYANLKTDKKQNIVLTFGTQHGAHTHAPQQKMFTLDLYVCRA